MAGRRKLAAMLARVGLQIAPSTIARRLATPRPPPRPGGATPLDGGAEHAAPGAGSPARGVIARYPGHVWHVDLTTIAIGSAGGGAWVPWWPFVALLRWCLSWHIAVAVDHFSRGLVGFAIFRSDPSSAAMCAFLDRAIAEAGAAPCTIITDQGKQFRSTYRAWCSRRGVRPRFGRVGVHGSVAYVERFIRTLKTEWLRCILVPFSRQRMVAAMAAYRQWYNEVRPHASLGGATPAERMGRSKARRATRLEPRPAYPLARGARRTGPLRLVVRHVDGARHLPVIDLRRAA